MTDTTAVSPTDVRSPVARLCVSDGAAGAFWRYPRGVAWCRSSAASTSALAQLPVQASTATDEVFMSGSCPERRATRFCTPGLWPTSSAVSAEVGVPGPP